MHVKVLFEAHLCHKEPASDGGDGGNGDGGDSDGDDGDGDGFDGDDELVTWPLAPVMAK